MWPLVLKAHILRYILLLCLIRIDVKCRQYRLLDIALEGIKYSCSSGERLCLCPLDALYLLIRAWMRYVLPTYL